MLHSVTGVTSASQESALFASLLGRNLGTAIAPKPIGTKKENNHGEDIQNTARTSLEV